MQYDIWVDSLWIEDDMINRGSDPDHNPDPW